MKRVVVTLEAQPKNPSEQLAEQESLVLNYTKISFIDEIIVFKTPHDVLGFYCHGMITTFAKLDGEGNINFDQLNVICNKCHSRPLFPLRGKITKERVTQELQLHQKIP